VTTSNGSDARADNPEPALQPAANAAADVPGPPLTPAEFEQMTTAAADRLHAAALRLSRNRADADDLVQDSLLRAWRALATFRRGTRFEAWLFRILHNSFLNRRRHENLAPEARDPETFDPDARTETFPAIRSLAEVPAIADRHFDDKVKAAVESLPEVYRVPFLLFSLGDMSYEEIANTLQVPIGTVMSRLHRARAHLRARLADDGGTK
jgi:RNA polymerase sigma-70 factor, ECF subfamily